jgi:two-component system sensor histidine kinase/response regulator
MSLLLSGLLGLAGTAAGLWGYRCHAHARDRESRVTEMTWQLSVVDQHAIVSITDLAGRILYVNDKFCAISGYRRDELLGNTHRIVKSDEHPPEFFATLWQTITRGETWHGQVKNRCKNGTFYWVSATVSPILGAHGRPVRYISIRTDITVQKQMELENRRRHRFFQAVTEAMGEGMYTLDANGICTFVNREAEVLLGWQYGDVVGQRLHDLVHYRDAQGEPLPAHACPIMQANAMGKVYQSEDQCFARRDGSAFPVRVIAVPLYEAGQVAGSVAVFQDISQRRRQEQELQQAKALAEAGDQMKGRFIATMSHELRTPLNAVVGLLHLMQEQVQHGAHVDPKLRDYLAHMDGSVAILNRIVRNILDFSRLGSAESQTVTETVFALEEVVCRAWEAVLARAHAKGLTTEYDMDPAVPVWVTGDAGRFESIVGQLLDNAVKFTERGRVACRVTRVAHPVDDRCWIAVTVADSGIGMSEVQLETIFQPFTQGDGSSTRRYGGLGMGLAVCQGAVEQLGGTLTVTSVAGEGSRFTATLPFQPAARSAEDEPPWTVSPWLALQARTAAAAGGVGMAAVVHEGGQGGLTASESTTALWCDADVSMLRAGLQEVAALLQDGDAHAADRFQTVRGCLTRTPQMTAYADQLAHQIAGYDFEEALLTVDALLAGMAQPGSGTTPETSSAL